MKRKEIRIEMTFKNLFGWTFKHKFSSFKFLTSNKQGKTNHLINLIPTDLIMQLIWIFQQLIFSQTNFISATVEAKNNIKIIFNKKKKIK